MPCACAVDISGRSAFFFFCRETGGGDLGGERTFGEEGLRGVETGRTEVRI